MSYHALALDDVTLVQIVISGGNGGGETPVPIPNTAGKPSCADGTARSPCGRVGRRRIYSRGPDLQRRSGPRRFVVTGCSLGEASPRGSCHCPRRIDPEVTYELTEFVGHLDDLLPPKIDRLTPLRQLRVVSA